MPPLLLLIILGLGVLVSLVALIWNLVLCGRQGVLWLLAVLFVPFANLVFLVKFWSEAKRPFFLSLAGFALVLAPVMMNPQAFPKDLADRFVPRSTVNPPPAASANAPATSPSLSDALQREQAALAEAERRQRIAQETRSAYEKHRAEADTLFKDLNARRAKLKVDDAKAVAAFNADAARYAALLEQAKAERTALESGSPVTAVSNPVVPAAGNGPLAPSPAGRGPGTANGARTAAAGTVPAGSPSLPKRALDKARAARDAASGAEDAGPFAGEVYGGAAPLAPGK